MLAPLEDDALDRLPFIHGLIIMPDGARDRVRDIVELVGRGIDPLPAAWGDFPPQMRQLVYEGFIVQQDKVSGPEMARKTQIQVGGRWGMELDRDVAFSEQVPDERLGMFVREDFADMVPLQDVRVFVDDLLRVIKGRLVFADQVQMDAPGLPMAIAKAMESFPPELASKNAQ